MEIIRNERTNGIFCVFMKGNQYYKADLSFTVDNGYECMIFHCDKNGKVISWLEVFVDWFDDVKEEYLLDCVNRFLKT